MYSNKKVVGISTVSQKEHLTAQVVATMKVLPQVTGRGKLRQNDIQCMLALHTLVLDLNVVEVAHDYQPQVTSLTS